MFVLHENSAGIDVNDANGVSAAGGDPGSCAFSVQGIGFKDHFPNLCLNVSRVIVFAVRSYKMHRIIIDGIDIVSGLAFGTLAFMLGAGAAGAAVVAAVYAATGLLLVGHPQSLTSVSLATKRRLILKKGMVGYFTRLRTDFQILRDRLLNMKPCKKIREKTCRTGRSFWGAFRQFFQTDSYHF